MKPMEKVIDLVKAFDMIHETYHLSIQRYYIHQMPQTFSSSTTKIIILLQSESEIPRNVILEVSILLVEVQYIWPWC